MVWLAEVADKHHNLSEVPRTTSKTLIAVTHDKDTVKFLTEIGHPDKEGVIKLMETMSENQIASTKLPILPATDVHREPSFSAEGGEELPPQHTGAQESSDSDNGRENHPQNFSCQV